MLILLKGIIGKGCEKSIFCDPAVQGRAKCEQLKCVKLGAARSKIKSETDSGRTEDE